MEISAVENEKLAKLVKAFCHPASDACMKIGRVLAEKKGVEFTVEELQKLTRHSERNIILALIRLTKDIDVIDSRPVISEHIEKGKEIPIKYKLKNEYVDLMQNHKHELFR